MNGSHRSNYATGLQLLDDGRARIDCPLKGVMAIARCREFQRDTAAAGKSCRCPVYEAYRAGEADDELPPPPTEALCGREVTRDLDEEIAELQVAKRKGTGEVQRRSAIVANKPTLDEEIAELQQKNRPRAERAAEEDTMTKFAKRCDRCKQLAPGDTKIFGGLCKPCRDKKKEGEASKTAAAPAAAPAKTIETIAEKHVDAAADKTVKPSETMKDRQQLMQPVVQSDFDRLTRAMKGLQRALNFATWIAQGVREGHIPIERLVEIEQRAAAERARS